MFPNFIDPFVPTIYGYNVVFLFSSAKYHYYKKIGSPVIYKISISNPLDITEIHTEEEEDNAQR